VVQLCGVTTETPLSAGGGPDQGGARQRALQIEHVGSTSVAGLAAKPVIDIVLVVGDSADEAIYVPDLEAAGYRLRHREPSWYQHRFLVGEPAVQIHVFSVGSAEVERMLLFRNRLRACPEDRKLYESTKRELAAPTGPMFRIMPTPSHRWWRRSSQGP